MENTQNLSNEVNLPNRGIDKIPVESFIAECESIRNQIDLLTKMVSDGRYDLPDSFVFDHAAYTLNMISTQFLNFGAAFRLSRFQFNLEGGYNDLF